MTSPNLFDSKSDQKQVIYHRMSPNGSISVFKPVSITEERLSLLKSCRICVDGNIGAGKTTLTKSIQRYLNRRNVSCGLAIEDMSNKMKMLGLFLENQKQYAFTFQMMMLSERISIYQRSLPEYTAGKTQIIDRSLVGDYSFAYLHHKYGNINEQEWEAYKEMLQKYSDQEFFKVPDYYLYLNISPEKALKRIAKRQRGNEAEKYNLDYLKDLSTAHQKSFNDLGLDYIEIKWDQDFQLDEEGLIDDKSIERIIEIILKIRIDGISS
jgi:deoxyadenosine/deoxycytidine kinase